MISDYDLEVITMSNIDISDSIIYVGCDDKNIDLFESQYPVPNGVSYNSYLIMDDKTCLMDTADKRVYEEWLQKVEDALGGRELDYLVISHMEPDHSGNIGKLIEKYPNVKIVGNAKTFTMYDRFFDIDITDRKVVVKEGDTLDLGAHKLTFVMAPMVHWPEVMVAYEASEKILFSADAFGKFGTLDTDEEWTCEGRRYYINIVGKYGAQVQALLKKAAVLDIKMICPLHGPVLKEHLEYYIDKYNTWSMYEPEDKGTLVAYASIHGNTAKAAEIFADILRKKGEEKVVVMDLSRADLSEAVEDAYRYDKLVVCSATYDASLFPAMEDFLYHLKIKNFQNRKVALMENGTWAPVANKLMRAYFEGMKKITICENKVSIKSSVNSDTIAEMEAMADELLA